MTQTTYRIQYPAFAVHTTDTDMAQRATDAGRHVTAVTSPEVRL